ncbi:hypothetical protein [Emergencia sp. 1XD21-10]|uniref:hypothetical protein n=1 Tax=Emergencia sp. 1XD21-10 TaxID=2304569 RepID=UPI001379B32D|nr:hypothetical protein [Emergencia sp. 1XD21-10]NCE98431.1 hypothetical protein [Emergencia sp. 1XD21-10]
MIKEALQYIVNLGEAKTQEIHGDIYSDKTLFRVEPYEPKAMKLTVNTLTGLLDYIKSGTDVMSDSMIVEVTSPTMVKVYSELDYNRNREYLIEADALLPYFSFDSFMDKESFCIALQSKFIKNDDRETLLKFAGTVEAGTIAQYGDDGVTQKATVKTGLTSKSEAIVPNPVLLKPYRTFFEVEQPESAFIFRMKEGSGVACAIFEADGGAWQIDAMQRIKDYLVDQLEDYPMFTVIA